MSKPVRNPENPALRIDGSQVRLEGRWILERLQTLDSRLQRTRWPPGPLHLDLAGVQELDTGGAWLVHRTVQLLSQQGRSVGLTGVSDQARPLLDAVARAAEGGLDAGAPPPRHWLEQLGRTSWTQARLAVGLLGFLGEMALATIPLLLRPARVRWRRVVDEIAEAGYRAVPIVGLLSFLLGVVIAFQGGVQLRQYGADAFVADLVGFSMLRELAPLITAIIVAGRTGSAYAAQIGTMRVTEEVNALSVMGVNPIEFLVVPKLLALFVALTLLTVFGDFMGLLGGVVIANAILGIGPFPFLDRVDEAVTLSSFLIGIGKAPVFAGIIAWIGCYQGFQVTGAAEDVGRRTTVSVVQSIFLVIVVDAMFSVAFSELGL